jgi:tetratricopeptide (TPR) repeat protein
MFCNRGSEEGGSDDMMQPCPNTLDREINNEKWKWFGWLGWLGWIGASLVVFGYYLNANMYVSSWLVWTVGNVLYWMADCYRQGKEYNSALIMLDKLLVMENPGRATDAVIQKGLIYRTLGKEELAMIMFRDLLDDYPESDYASLVEMELNSVELY